MWGVLNVIPGSLNPSSSSDAPMRNTSPSLHQWKFVDTLLGSTQGQRSKSLSFKNVFWIFGIWFRNSQPPCKPQQRIITNWSAHLPRCSSQWESPSSLQTVCGSDTTTEIKDKISIYQWTLVVSIHPTGRRTRIEVSSRHQEHKFL